MPAAPLLDTRHPYLVLTLLCLVLWLPGFFTLPPSDRDESRFAEATKQMLESGDFVRILNGTVERNRKPIGIYWLQAPFAAAARATGLARANPIWPYRMPSLLGGLAAVLATFGLGQRIVGRLAALLGAAMLGASVVLVVETHIAKTDAALLAATTVTMGLLARAYLDPGDFARRHAAGFWLALGAGILLKGPITPMVAGLAAISLVIADRRERGAGWLASLRPGWGVPLMLVVVLPWFLAIGLATQGRFFAEAVGGDLGRKLTGDDEAHGAPPGTHLALLPLTLFPASIVIVAALPAAWRARAEPATRFLLAWVLPSWLVFEAVPTKLPHYTLPLFPPLCLFAARWAELAKGSAGRSPVEWPAEGVDTTRLVPPRWWSRLAFGAFAVAAALIGIGAVLLPAVVLSGLGWTDIFGVAGLLAASLVAWLVLRSRPDWQRMALAGALAMPLVTWPVLGVELPRLAPLWIAPHVAAALRAHWPAGRPGDRGFGAVGFAEPSLMFLCGTDTRLFGNAAEGARFLAGAGDRVVAVERRDLPAFREAAARLGLSPRAFTTVGGFNYSRGRRMELTLFGR